jgi:ATP-dependent RNA helicase DDX27
MRKRLGKRTRRMYVRRIHSCFTSDIAQKPKRDKFSGLTRRAKRRKLAREADAELDDRREIDAAVRSAKRAQRPGKIGEPLKQHSSKVRKKKSKVKLRQVGFDKDLADRSKGPGARQREGMRAKKGEGVKGLKPKQPKGKSR